MLHGGRNNVVQNNVIVGCKYQYTLNNEVLTRPGNEPIYDFLSGNRFIRNIFYATDPDSFLFAAHFLNRDRADTTPDTADQVAERLEAAVGEADHNVLFGAFELSEVVEYWNGWPTAARPAYYSLDRWRALGFDAGTVLGDPLFVDPAKDDYRLMPESPALSLGFVQIDAGAIGIRTPGPFTDR
jgi:hypothetical protein